MQQISAKEFEASTLAVLEEVRRTRMPIRIKRNGKPPAEIVPPVAEINAKLASKQREFGLYGGKIKLSDIVGPIYDKSEWGDLL